MFDNSRDEIISKPAVPQTSIAHPVVDEVRPGALSDEYYRSFQTLVMLMTLKTSADAGGEELREADRWRSGVAGQAPVVAVAPDATAGLQPPGSPDTTSLPPSPGGRAGGGADGRERE